MRKKKATTKSTANAPVAEEPVREAPVAATKQASRAAAAPTHQKYKALYVVPFRGKTYNPGEVILLDTAEDSKRLKKIGAVTEVVE